MELFHSKECNTTQTDLQLIQSTLDLLLKKSGSGLIQPLCNLLCELKKRNSPSFVPLKQKLVLLGLDEKSENFGWFSQPPKEQVISALLDVQSERNIIPPTSTSSMNPTSTSLGPTDPVSDPNPWTQEKLDPTLDEVFALCLYGCKLAYHVKDGTSTFNPLSGKVRPEMTNFANMTYVVESYEVSRFLEDAKSLHYVILHAAINNVKYHLICFRGSRSPTEHFWDDWLTTNFNIFGKTADGGMVGFVHSGFEKLLEDNVHLKYFQSFIEKGERVVFTGHSLGGALAINATRKFLMQLPLDLQKKQIPNLLSPFTVNKDAARWMDLKNWSPYFHNIIHLCDPVPVILSALFQGQEDQRGILNWLANNTKVGELTNLPKRLLSALKPWLESIQNIAFPEYDGFGKYHIFEAGKSTPLTQLNPDFWEKCFKKNLVLSLQNHFLDTYIQTLASGLKIPHPQSDPRPFLPIIEDYHKNIIITSRKIFLDSVISTWVPKSNTLIPWKTEEKISHTITVELKGENLHKIREKSITISIANTIKNIKISESEPSRLEILIEIQGGVPQLSQCEMKIDPTYPKIKLSDFHLYNFGIPLQDHLYDNADLLHILNCSWFQILFLESISTIPKENWMDKFDQLLKLEKELIQPEEKSTDPEVALSCLLPLVDPKDLTPDTLTRILIELTKENTRTNEETIEFIRTKLKITQKTLPLCSLKVVLKNFQKISKKEESPLLRTFISGKPILLLIYIRLIHRLAVEPDWLTKGMIHFLTPTWTVKNLAAKSNNFIKPFIYMLGIPIFVANYAIALPPTVLLTLAAIPIGLSEYHQHQTQNYRSRLRDLLQIKEEISDFDMEAKLLKYLDPKVEKSLWEHFKDIFKSPLTTEKFENKVSQLRFSIPIIHSLRIFCKEYLKIGVVGDARTGKSTFLNMAFNFDTKPSASIKTKDCKPFLLFPDRKILLIDFPGTNETDQLSLDVRFKDALTMLSGLSCLVAIQDFRNPPEDHMHQICDMAEQYGIPTLYLLNQFGVFLSSESTIQLKQFPNKPPYNACLIETNKRWNDTFKSWFLEKKFVDHMITDMIGYMPNFTEEKIEFVIEDKTQMMTRKERFLQKYPEMPVFKGVDDVIDWLSKIIIAFDDHQQKHSPRPLPVIKIEEIRALKKKTMVIDSNTTKEDEF